MCTIITVIHLIPFPSHQRGIHRLHSLTTESGDGPEWTLILWKTSAKDIKMYSAQFTSGLLSSQHLLIMGLNKHKDGNKCLKMTKLRDKVPRLVLCHPDKPVQQSSGGSVRKLFSGASHLFTPSLSSPAEDKRQLSRCWLLIHSSHMSTQRSTTLPVWQLISPKLFLQLKGATTRVQTTELLQCCDSFNTNTARKRKQGKHLRQANESTLATVTLAELCNATLYVITRIDVPYWSFQVWRFLQKLCKSLIQCVEQWRNSEIRQSEREENYGMVQVTC